MYSSSRQQLDLQLPTQLQSIHPTEYQAIQITTETIIDNRVGQISDYKKTKQLYQQLIEKFIDEQKQLEQFQLLPYEYDENQRVIYFLPGSCSIQQLIEEPNFNTTPDQAVQIFSILLDSILTMKDHGFNHADLKPENIYLVGCKDHQNMYMLKQVDLDLIANPKYTAQTPVILNDTLDSDFNNIMSKNSEEKFKNQIYSLIRFFQFILYGIKHQQNFQINSDEDSCRSNYAELAIIQIEINKQYTNSNQNHSINKILEFITQKGLQEIYTFDELQAILINLKQDKNNEYIYFYDAQNIIQQIEQKCISRIKQTRSDPLALFIRLKTLTKQIGSRSQLRDSKYNIIQQLKQKLTQNENYNIMIVGEKGAGKTLLLFKLIQDLKTLKDFNYNIVHINLADIINESKSEARKQFFNAFQQQLQVQQKREQLLVLIDSYDQLNDNLKKIKISKVLRTIYIKIRLIVSTTPDFATGFELNSALGQHEKIYMNLFQRDQQLEYLTKISEFYNQNQEYASQHYQFLNKSEQYLQIVYKNATLERLSRIPLTFSLIILAIKEIKAKFLSNKLHTFTKYEIYQTFINDYINKKIKSLCEDEQYKKRCIEKYGQTDYAENFRQDVKLFNQSCSWQMLRQHNFVLSQNAINMVLNWVQVQNYGSQLLGILDLVIKASPSQAINTVNFSYVYQEFQEFYVAQSVIEETINAKQQAVNENSSLLGKAYLRFNLNILSLLCEHVMEMPLNVQYLKYFETWYKSVLLTRKIKSENITDKQIIDKLQKIGSNCVNLLAGPARCDLTHRDFSDCAIPYAYLYKRDLSGCNFTHTNMDNSLLTEARLDHCLFIESSLKNLKYNQFIDLKGHLKTDTCIAFSSDGKYLASSADNTVRIWSVEAQKLISTLRGCSLQVDCIAFSSDGKYLATSSQEHTVKLWNIQNQKIIAKIHTKCQYFTKNSLAFSPDCIYLAYISSFN